MLYTNFPRRRRTLHPCSPSFSHSFALFHTLSLSGFLLSDFWSAIKVLKSMFKCWTKRHNNSMAKTKVAPPIHPPPANFPREHPWNETLEKDTFCRSCWLVYLFSWPSFPLQNSQRPLCGDTSFLPLALSTAFCAFVVCAACNWLGFTPDTSVIDISNKFRLGQSHFRCDTINSGPSKSVPITQVSTHPPNFIVAFSIWLIQIAL